METYSASIDGTITNTKTNHILKPFKVGNYLGIHYGSKCKKYIHHLVAYQWLPAPTEENLVIDHIDRNRHNNHASNLRWVSKSVNSKNRTIELRPRGNTLSGEHHIKRYCGKRQINPTFVVELKQDTNTQRKCFKNIEDAKTWRDIIINNAICTQKSP